MGACFEAAEWKAQVGLPRERKPAEQGWWEWKMVQLFWKTVRQFLKSLNSVIKARCST
jgi:hypothetical protein